MEKDIFYDLIGQKRIKEMLVEIEHGGNVGHAYIFNGPGGIGRKTVARKFASLLTCTSEHSAGKVCGRCEACMLAENSSNPDVVFVGLPKDKKTVSVDSIREMREDMLTAPLVSRSKVYVIEHGDKMTAEAQNALLKILEEPPLYVVIIIISANPLLLLDTVRSRAIRIDFSRNSEEEIKEAYRRMRGGDADSSEEALICSYADGIIGRVYEFGDWDEIKSLQKQILEAMCELCNGKYESRKKLISIMNKKGEESELVLFTLISFYRDIMHLVRFGKNARLQNKEYKDKLYDTGRDIGYYNAKACIKIIDDTWKDIMRNAAYSLAVENMAIKLQEVMTV
ncbi:MAG: hypothetical protein IJZ90_00445 [Clostridia bacterium]|nr:hypothetical protein [Clostridia bacterium]